MAPSTLRTTVASETGMAKLAVALGHRLVRGDTILLEGPIGAGKTFFARALIQARLEAAGLWEDVPSPSYTLVQTYDDDSEEIWHADLYRLSSPEDCAELGLDEAFGHAITLIEWPDRLGDLCPTDALTLSFELGKAEGHRNVAFNWSAPKWNDRLRDLPGTTEIAFAD